MSKTYGQQMDEALACKTKKEAVIWLHNEAAEMSKETGRPVKECAEMIKSNLGYMAGYYDKEIAAKVLKLFSAPHPVFGVDYH